MRHQKSVTFETRLEIERLLNEGFRQVQICRTLSMAKSTVSTEINRCPPGKYNAVDAQKSVHKRINRNFPDTEKDREILHLVSIGVSAQSIRKKFNVSRHYFKKLLSQNSTDSIPNKSSDIENRLANLEQQFEILFDLIKEKL